MKTETKHNLTNNPLAGALAENAPMGGQHANNFNDTQTSFTGFVDGEFLTKTFSVESIKAEIKEKISVEGAGTLVIALDILRKTDLDVKLGKNAANYSRLRSGILLNLLHARDKKTYKQVRKESGYGRTSLFNLGRYANIKGVEKHLGQDWYKVLYLERIAREVLKVEGLDTADPVQCATEKLGDKFLNAIVGMKESDCINLAAIWTAFKNTKNITLDHCKALCKAGVTQADAEKWHTSVTEALSKPEAKLQEVIEKTAKAVKQEKAAAKSLSAKQGSEGSTTPYISSPAPEEFVPAKAIEALIAKLPEMQLAQNEQELLMKLVEVAQTLVSKVNENQKKAA